MGLHFYMGTTKILVLHGPLYARKIRSFGNSIPKFVFYCFLLENKQCNAQKYREYSITFFLLARVLSFERQGTFRSSGLGKTACNYEEATPYSMCYCVYNPAASLDLTYFGNGIGSIVTLNGLQCGVMINIIYGLVGSGSNVQFKQEIFRAVLSLNEVIHTGHRDHMNATPFLGP